MVGILSGAGPARTELPRLINQRFPRKITSLHLVYQFRFSAAI